MAIIPTGQKFHTVPSSVNTQEKGSALANSQREIYTMQDIIDTLPSTNPSVVALSATDGTVVTGTLTETISRSLLIPANTFTNNGMLEVIVRQWKTGVAGNQWCRLYKNTSNTLTGATLIATPLSNQPSLLVQGIRTFRINSNILTGLPTSTASQIDYGVNNNPVVSTTFNTSVDNYILFAITLASTLDSSVVEMARAVKYI